MQQLLVSRLSRQQDHGLETVVLVSRVSKPNIGIGLGVDLRTCDLSVGLRILGIGL